MNIVVLSNMYPNSVMYRSGIFVHEQVKELTKLGVNVTVVAPVPYFPKVLSFLNKKWCQYSRIPEFEVYDGVEVYHSRYIAVPGGFLKGFWPYIYVNRVIKKLGSKKISGFDLIHAHGSLPDDFSAYLLSKKFNIPYLATVHGESVFSLSRYPRRFVQTRKALLNCKALIGVSSVVIRKVEKLTGRVKNNFIVYNGFKEPEKVQVENSESSGNKIVKILFAAALIERKGCYYLLNAFKKIIDKFSNVKLIIAGGGHLLMQMKSLAEKLEISKFVEFTGIIQHKLMMSYMAKCDIFILPSWDEAFGVVYLEAMSYKKPAIGTEDEGVADFIEDGKNGFLVKPRDMNSIVEKLSQLIQSPELREKFGASGYEAVKNLTWQNNARGTLEVYERVLKVPEA